MKLISINKVSKMLGVSTKTIRRWEKDKKINVFYTPNGHRRYEEDYILNNFINNIKNVDDRINIIYCRVSTNNQKVNLDNQINELKSFCVSNGIIVDDVLYDIASGLNYNRNNFLKLIDMILQKKINKIIISYPDRLTRFSFKFFEWLFIKYDVELVVTNKTEISQEQEMTEDLISIIQHYASKLYGKRSYKKKLIQLIENTEH